MQIANSLKEIPKSSLPVVLTIGNFDGVHLGHQALLKHLVHTAKTQHATTAVLTFSNHPSLVLRPNHPTSLLCTIDHKIKLLKEATIDLAILLPFTKELASHSADFFLNEVKEFLSFNTLILGSDAHIGKNREGNQSTLTALAKILGFSVEYFPDYNQEGKRISSSQIRKCIEQGKLKQAEALLGRPYSIYGIVLKGNGRGAPLGFPTANLNIDTLCLPPFGVYAVTLIENGKPLRGVANLGLAPTVRIEPQPVLEVHLLDTQIDLYSKTADVHFHDFIRHEKRFESIEDLKKQIAQDVLIAKEIHKWLC